MDFEDVPSKPHEVARAPSTSIPERALPEGVRAMDETRETSSGNVLNIVLSVEMRSDKGRPQLAGFKDRVAARHRAWLARTRTVGGYRR